MKIQRCQVIDPLDRGEYKPPYLLLDVNEPLKRTADKEYGDWSVCQYGPFFDVQQHGWTRPMERAIGRFNQLDQALRAPKLINVMVSINGTVGHWFGMDLKRSRAELKKCQREQDWVIRLDDLTVERTGDLIWRPKKVRNSQCGGWIGKLGMDAHRCLVNIGLKEYRLGHVIVPLCSDHAYEHNHAQAEARHASKSA
jgi:ribosomal protein L37AE/L43A